MFTFDFFMRSALQALERSEAWLEVKALEVKALKGMKFLFRLGA